MRKYPLAIYTLLTLLAALPKLSKRQLPTTVRFKLVLIKTIKLDTLRFKQLQSSELVQWLSRGHCNTCFSAICPVFLRTKAVSVQFLLQPVWLKHQLPTVTCSQLPHCHSCPHPDIQTSKNIMAQQE